MDVSLTLDFRNPTRRPWRELWEDNLWLMREAEAMGFCQLFVQEHFFTSDGYGPSVPIFLTALAERTQTARLGSYLYILPLHNPLALAQEIAVLDNFCGGRLDVVLGAGSEPNSLLANGGTAIMIHAKADDYKTDPSGNSGDRIACGVIEK